MARSLPLLLADDSVECLDDLDMLVVQITERGLEPSQRETYSNGVRKITYRDFDGNEIGFGGAPLKPTSGQGGGQ